ncbi:MAG: hypothetical protein KDA96_10055, partial [Planctomycetaceae bacterium]|nr:hypothetical protein [Planctomycetaceae bacterium]
EEKMEKISRIDRYLCERFSCFLDQLKSIREGERTLLDNSMIVYGSAISDGNRHNHDDLPLILAGRAGGTIESGRHITFPKETPLNNLFLTMSDHIGGPIEQIGNSTGRLSLSAS